MAKRNQIVELQIYGHIFNEGRFIKTTNHEEIRWNSVRDGTVYLYISMIWLITNWRKLWAFRDLVSRKDGALGASPCMDLSFIICRIMHTRRRGWTPFLDGRECYNYALREDERKYHCTTNESFRCLIIAPLGEDISKEYCWGNPKKSLNLEPHRIGFFHGENMIDWSRREHCTDRFKHCAWSLHRKMSLAQNVPVNIL